MLKKLWNSLNSPPAKSHAKPSAFDGDKLKLLAEHFPIGKKLRYYPEYQRQIALNTIILAYRVNDHFIYSRDAVRLDAAGNVAGFRVGEKKILPLASLEQIHVLLPDTTEMEKTLDYFTRAELGPAGQFSKGNTITLVANSTERSIFSVDTHVYRRQIMKSGPYVDSSTVLVRLDLDSLALTDKRRKQRMAASVRADLFLGAGSPAFPCVLQDFSETSMRLRAGNDGTPMPAMATRDKATVAFGFGDAASSYRIRGKVIRHTADFCVIQLEELDRDGEFERIKMIDVVEIKSAILNLSA